MTQSDVSSTDPTSNAADNKRSLAELTASLPSLSDVLSELTEAELQGYAEAAKSAIGEIVNPADLQQMRVTLTGKKSALTGWSKQMGKLDADSRKTKGGWLHQVRTQITDSLNAQQQVLEEAALNAKLEAERIDITLPARGQQKGQLHPVTMTAQRMQQFFMQASTLR